MNTVIKLRTEQIASAGRILARAFYSDPFFRYILPDAATRQEKLNQYACIYVKASCLMDTVHGTGMPLSGVAVWTAPGRGLTPEERSEAGMDRLPDIFGLEGFERYLGMVAHLSIERARDVPLAHWYLSILGVDPTRQGEGIGGALLQPILKVSDQTDTPCYLETFVEENLAFYTHHGFRILVAGVEPRSSIPFWTMTRTPLA